MRDILKPIFHWLTGNYNLFDNVIYNWAAMSLVGVLAFGVAWRMVGRLYFHNIISGRAIGSLMHWSVRFIAFVVIFTLFGIIIWFVQLIISIPAWVWYLLIGFVILVLLTFIYMKLRNSNKNKVF